MTNIIIHGSKGRMGQALFACVPKHPGIAVVGQIDAGDDIRSVMKQADVVVDFSDHTATLGLVDICAKNRKALVIGTTGHTDRERLDIACHSDTLAADAIPIVMASNFSTGVNTLFWLTHKAAELLGPDFDLEVVEMHHRLKKDAPSGTAKTLAEILEGVRAQQLQQELGDKDIVLFHGRVGNPGVRSRFEIGIHSVRGGDVVGDHTVIFAADGERVELTHKASSRETFANGALRAAAWVVNQPPGLYSMQHVLGLV